MELPQNYNAQLSEKKWQSYWSEKEVFVFHSDLKRETYSIDTPPPTVSGKMHMGHAFSYTQQDVVARYMRMKGKNVFFPFGTDDNGLPTERLIEKSRNINANQVDRAEFINICNEVVAIEKPKFIQSWKDIGMSADFSRSYSTISKHCQITSQASFIDLFHKGKIYAQESPVAWCVSCQTAIAQAEFESVELPSHFNEIAFLCGSEKLVIATTRPEMLPACVALCCHPDDARYKMLQGKTAVVPLFDYSVPIICDESVDMTKGTGLMMVCTFGDKEDVEKWHKHKLPLRVVFEKYGKMNALAGPFAGLKIKDARAKIIESLREKGLLISQKSIVHAVNVHERCKTEIEFLKTKQWYIRVLDAKDELLRVGSEIEWYPAHMKVRYDHWVENLGWDWCISRQRPFGIPIPVWFCSSCSAIVVPELSELPVDPSLSMPMKKCVCGSTSFVGEKDVLDTWATSSITPEISSNWAHKGEYDVVHQNVPFDLRPQAHDIIRTWLFYTIVKSYFHFGRAPWKRVMISGHAQDPSGRKMSKSLGNIIEPQDMIVKYSADALRFWAAGATLGDDMPFQDKDLMTGQKFATKLWNVMKFSMMHLEDYESAVAAVTLKMGVVPSSVEVGGLELFDRWLLSKLHKMITLATSRFDAFEYAKAKVEIEMFFWHALCDNYLEIVKDRLYNPQVRGVDSRVSAQFALDNALLGVLKAMAPIMPHITEEIYQLRYAKSEGTVSLHVSSWSAVPDVFLDLDVEKVGDMCVDVITTVRKYKSENKWSMKEPLAMLRIAVGGVEGAHLSLFDCARADLIAVTGARDVEFVVVLDAPTHTTEQFRIAVEIVK